MRSGSGNIAGPPCVRPVRPMRAPSGRQIADVLVFQGVDGRTERPAKTPVDWMSSRQEDGSLQPMHVVPPETGRPQRRQADQERGSIWAWHFSQKSRPIRPQPGQRGG
jgi:hypothetical protein